MMPRPVGDLCYLDWEPEGKMEIPDKEAKFRKLFASKRRAL
jgi:hypothetical protein